MTIWKAIYTKMLLLAALLAVGLTATAQSWNMQNRDTVRIDACQYATGTIYDNGGRTGNYSDSFDGWVLIEAYAGATINLSGSYITELGADFLYIWDNDSLIANQLSGSGSLNYNHICHSGRVIIRFTSNGGGTRSGFSIQYSVYGGTNFANGVTNLTANAISATGATLTWTSSSNGPFHILCDDPVADTLTTTARTYTLTGLNPSVLHHVEVYAEGMRENRCAIGRTQFRTACGTGWLPLIEDFDDVATDSMTPCWTRSVNFDDAYTLPRVLAFDNGNKAQMLSCGSNNTGSHFGMVITPQIVGASEEWLVGFKMMVSHSNTRVIIGFCDSTSDEQQSYGFTAVETLSPSTNNWIVINRTYTVPDGKCRLAFRMEQNMQNNISGKMAYIDSLHIESCGVRDAEINHIDQNSFDVYWTLAGNPEVTVKVMPEWGGGNEIVFENAVSPLTVTGLTSGTKYAVAFYPVCDGVQQSPVRTYASTISYIFDSILCLNLAHYNESTGLYELADRWTSISSNYFTNTTSSGAFALGRDGFLVSPPLIDPSGKELKISYYSSHPNTDRLVIGTLTYIDDINTFTPLDTVQVRSNSGFADTLIRLPNGITDHYLAIKGLCPTTSNIQIHSLSLNDGHVIGARFVKIKSTQVTLQWNSPTNDTVIIEYFANGEHTHHFDTVINGNQAVITGLMRLTEYHFYLYRPGNDPCPTTDEIFNTTARRDYDLPYCEDFEYHTELDQFVVDENYGWNVENSLFYCPAFSVEYTHSGGRSLKLAAASGNLQSTIKMPEIENTAGSVISFWAYSLSPASAVVVGYFLPNSSTFHAIDSLHIEGNTGWHHYAYTLPSNLTGRIALRYVLTGCEGIYYVWIDDLELGSANYGNFTFANLTGTNVDVVWQAAGTTDSITVILISNHDTVTASGVPDTIHITGLIPMRYYTCYVLPHGGCITQGGIFFTLDYASSDGDSYICQTMDELLSYELPQQWTFSDSNLVSLVDDNNGGYWLQILSPSAPGAWVQATLPVVDSPTLYLVARGLDNGTQMAVNGDTVVLDTTWQAYAFSPADTSIISISGGAGCLIDSVSLSPCPNVEFSIDGNVLTCTMTGNQTYEYVLNLSDGHGDERGFHITTPTFTIPDLQPSVDYRIWWNCLYMNPGCQPSFLIHTEAIPLPYCISFVDNNNTLPAGWFVTQREGLDDVTFDGTDHMRFSAAYNKWNYLVLPVMEHSNLLLLTIFGAFSGQELQVGHLTNGSDTGSFVIDTIVPSNAMSVHAFYSFGLNNIGSKRIALRYKGYSLTIQSIGLMQAPKLNYHLYSPSHLTLERTADTSYRVSYNHGTDNWVNRNIITSTATFPFNNYSEIYVKQLGNNADCIEPVYFRRPSTFELPFCDDIYYDDLSYTYRQHPMNSSLIHFDYIDNRDCYCMSPSPKPVIFIFPYLNNSSVYNCRITFECKASLSNSAIEIGVMTDLLDSSSFVPVDTLTCSNTSWHRVYIDLSSYSGSGRWIAFKAQSNMSNGNFYFDNLRIDACHVPATINLRRENYTEIVFEGNNDPDANGPFWVEYGQDWFSPGQGTLVRFDSLPARLNLSPSTTYGFYIYCSNNRRGCSNYHVITTLDLPLSVPSCTGFDSYAVGYTPQGWSALNGPIAVTNTTSHRGSRSLSVCGTVATPEIETDSLSHIAAGLWVKTTQPGAYLIVGTITSPNNPSSFHPIKTIVPKETNSWEYHMISFTDAPPNARRIALRNASGTNNNLFVDDFLITQCAAFDLRILNFDNSSILLGWQQLGTPDATIDVHDNTAHSVTSYDISSLPGNQLLIPIYPQHDLQIVTTSSCPTEAMPCASTYTDTINVVVPAEGLGCVDPSDLRSSQAVFFSGSYSNPYANRGAIDFGNLRPESRHTINTDTSARDPRTGNQLRLIPQGYSSSVRLGNWNTNASLPEAEGVIYSLRVDTVDFSLLLMQYAAVLQDPMHAPEDQPRFRLELLDSNFNLIDPACAAADFIANRNLGWNSAPNNVLWKDWTTVGVDLSNYHGQQLYLRLTTYDCNEGSHYGYAYFTLECLLKNIRTQTCGNVDSNIFSAPAGFNYRWYTTSDTSTLSTSRSLVVPSSQSTVYLCDLSFINNPSCSFTLSAFGGSRYPLARVDTIVSYSNCRINVQFLNRSTVSSDGINPVSTNEMAETAWWDFGNGLSSDSYNGYTSYSQPGTYTVTLVAGISGGLCTDTLVFPITVDFPSHPLITGPDLICLGDLDTLRLLNASSTDTLWQQTSSYQFLPLSADNCVPGDSLYTVTATDPYGCTHMVSHLLHVLPSYTHLDTVHLCSPQLPFQYADTLFLPGTAVADYHHVGLTSAGCDSSFHLHLQVSPLLATTVLDTLLASICDNESYSFFNHPYNEAGHYMVNHIDPQGRCDSLHSLFLEVRPTSAVDTFASACDRFNWYGTLYFSDTLVHKLDTNIYLCDSTTSLHLSVYPTYDLSDHIVVCPNQSYIYEGVDYGGPIAFDSPHLSVHGCDSLVHVQLYPSNPLFPAPPIVSLDSIHWYPVDTLFLACQPQQLYLLDTSISISRTWTLSPYSTLGSQPTTLSDTSRLFRPLLDTSSLFSLSLVSVSDEGCVDTLLRDSLILLRPSPSASFLFSPDHLSIHDPHIQFFNTSAPDTCTYLWLFPLDPSASSFDSSLTIDPYYSWEINTDTGCYPVSLIAYLTHTVTLTPIRSDTLVCTDTATIPVRIVNTYLQFPNLVTPNGDGINDTWRVVNLLEMGEYSMNELWIYDRFGAPVYHVKNISKESDFWNPLDTHSPDGTYYFRFMAKNNFGVVKRNGVIEVVR